MTAQVQVYAIKELSRETWHYFERLFTQKNGWDHCWCMHFHRPCGMRNGKLLRGIRADRAVINRREKLELVEKGRSHGILVYVEGEPVGWCQYGPQEELPRIDNSRKYRTLALEVGSHRLWRITFFVVHKSYRRRGVARAALKAALEAIRRKGGGIVEAYPIARWESYPFGNESTHGTASIFEKEGFREVISFGHTRFSSHILMRRKV